MRRQVLDGYRFPTRHRNEAEDQVVVIRSLKAGFRFAYIDAVHVVYHVHAENSSGRRREVPWKSACGFTTRWFRGSRTCGGRPRCHCGNNAPCCAA
jgi:hypothetical protein